MFIDTHCHLNIMVKKDSPDAWRDLPLKESDFPLIEQMIYQAQQNHVSTIINVGTTLQESKNSIAIAQRFPSVYATVGIHPCDTKEHWRDEVKALESLVKEKEHNKIVGIGEVGLDFYHKPYDEQRQKDAFKAQIELALKYDLGLVIHVRDAGDELLRVLEEYAKEIKRATIHCFAQSLDFAKIVTEWGFYIGIDAPITYPKNELLREVVRVIAVDHLVLETDAPFLPPQQLRGKPNHPSYIPIFAQVIAELKKMSLEQLAQATSKNARRLFKLDAQ